jgi:hypothetical protein
MGKEIEARAVRHLLTAHKVFDNAYGKVDDTQLVLFVLLLSSGY